MKRLIKTSAVILMALAAENSVAQTAETAKTQIAKVNGKDIAYRSIGKGSPILVANRMRGTLDTWDPVFLDELAKSHTVITFDYPGIGYSTGTLPTDMSEVAKFVKDLSGALKLKKFGMLGWSWGAYLTQATLLEYPELVSHAILVGTNPPGKNELKIQEQWVERAFKPVNDLDDEIILFFEPKSEASRKAAKESHDRIYKRPGVADKIASTQDIFELFFKGHGTFLEDKQDRRTQLTKTQIPVLIICGDNDTSVPVGNWYPLIGKIPKGQLVVFPESGHGPQHQYPELSAKYVTDFIKYTK
jgi:pimeloyl-ACP methyl ester carboxylesterase